MAIGSVEELIDYKEKTLELIKKNCPSADMKLSELDDVTVTSPTSGQALIWDGTKWVNGQGKTSLDAIADEYDPNHSTSYPNNDMVIYEEKLYRSTQVIPVMIGEFDETMWDEIPDYDPTATYEGTAKVLHEGTPYKKNPMVPSVTGEWNSSYWIEITPTDIENYDPTSTTVYDALDDDGTYLATNSDFAMTGGVGEFDSTKWTETTVEACLSAIHVPVIQRDTKQICSSADVRTDANGYLTNAIPEPTISATVVYVAEVRVSGLPAMMNTVFAQFEQGLSNGVFTRRVRLVDGSGEPIASSTGLTDMGNINITYIGVTP